MRVLNYSNLSTYALDAVYIGRPTKFGNPFFVGKDGTREEVIAKHKEWVLNNTELTKVIKEELAGKDLICYCSPLACHGDILLEIANA